jgi:hypothetical protein
LLDCITTGGELQGGGCATLTARRDWRFVASAGRRQSEEYGEKTGEMNSPVFSDLDFSPLANFWCGVDAAFFEKTKKTLYRDTLNLRWGLFTGRIGAADGMPRMFSGLLSFPIVYLR